MNAIVGCIVVGIGIYVTLFTESAIGFARARMRPRWLSDLFGSDIISLFIWLGGIGFILAGGLMVFWSLTAMSGR